MSQPVYRYFEREDLAGFMTLIRANGFPERSAQGWMWAIFESPRQDGHPHGIVAERNGEIIAFAGLQIEQVWRGRERKSIAGGHNLITLPSGRGYGLRVLKRLLNYSNVDAVVTTNSNALSSRIFPLIGAVAVLGDEGRARLEWPLRPVSRVVGRGMSFLARSDHMYRFFQRREWFGPSMKADWGTFAESGINRLNPFDPEFSTLVEQFDRELRSERPESFLPHRSVADYRWRLSDPDFPDRSLLVGAFNENRLIALAMVTMCKPNTHEPWMAYLTDYVALEEAEAGDASARLIRCVKQAVRRRGAVLLRMQPCTSMPDRVRKETGRHVVKRVEYDFTHVRFNVSGEPLKGTFTPGPFDGDLFFALRSPLLGA